MNIIRVGTKHPYNVHIERGSLEKSGMLISEILKSKKTVVVTDDTVDKLYSDTLIKSLEKYGISSDVFVFPHGEYSKNLDTLADIFDFLCEKNITRSDFLIALGGGVVGDITGFAAASFLRGIDFVQIPTTLLAQIDSSVGGKTAVDIKGGKNLVGAFKQPSLVICDSDVLKTLPDSELSCGMAEAIKYGMIRDKKLFELFEKYDLSSVHEVMDEIVYTCVDIKRQIVENDEFEKGERRLLNFGHTLGHAIESWHEYKNFTHGMGVAIGMCLITRRFCDPSVAQRLEKCINAYGLPTDTEAPMNELMPFCSKDKKCESGNISYIVCPEPGISEIRKVSVKEFSHLMGVQ